MAEHSQENSSIVTREEVEKIAELSRLHLTGDELQSMTHDFNQILQFVRQIDIGDALDLEPIGHLIGQKNIRREDVPGQSFSPEEIEKIAPEWENSSFVVPQVVDRNDSQ